MNRRTSAWIFAGCLACGAALAVTPPIVAGPPTDIAPIGDQFLVNSYTTRSQNIPEIGMASDGRFTVTWTSERILTGPVRGPLARSFSPAASATSEDFQPAGGGEVAQITNDVAQETVGGDDITLFAIVDDIGPGAEVYARAYVSGAAESTEPVQLSTPSDAASLPVAFVTSQESPTGVIGGVVWQQRDSSSDNATDIFFSRVDIATDPALTAGGSAGLTASTPIQVNTFADGDQVLPKACVLGTGDVVVAWRSDEEARIKGKLLSPDGDTVANDFEVAQSAIGQSRLDVCCSDDRFVVAWDTASSAFFGGPNGADVKARIYDQDGIPIATEFEVNTIVSDDEYNPRLGCDSEGSFVVAWRVASGITVQAGSFARAFDRDGNAFSGDDYAIALNFGTTDIALNDNGVATAVWSESTTLDGADRADIIGQRLAIGGSITSTTTMPGAEVCGDPLDPGGSLNVGIPATAGIITASDALFVLSAAVGAEMCADCVCDVNGDGSVTATDALLLLNAAVGIDVTLNCPPCS